MNMKSKISNILFSLTIAFYITNMVQFQRYNYTMGYCNQKEIYMVNQEKVALMTKLAIYEENEGRRNIPMGKYYKEDYVSLHMVNTVIVATFSYVLIIAAIIFAHLEQMMVEIANMDFIKAGKDIIIGYAITIVVYLIISYIVYTIRFKRVRKNLNEYNSNLKKLYGMYEENEE